MEVLGKKNHNKYEINGLKSLSNYTLDFLTATWPIFSSSILKIVFVYFDIDEKVSIKNIENDYKALKSFGLERLFSRLVILRATAGNSDDKEFVNSNKQIWNDANYNNSSYKIIKSHIEDNAKQNFTIPKECASTPIEQATILLIYLHNRLQPIDFVDRLIKVYEIDQSIIYLINFDAYQRDIDETRFTPSPEIIFMGSILNDKFVLRRNKKVSMLYGAGGLHGDLDIYLRNVRKKSTKMISLLRTFKNLPTKCRNQTLNLLLKSDISYFIAHHYPTYTSNEHDDNKGEHGALKTRLALTQLIKSNYNIGNEHLLTIEEEIKNNLRELEYRKDDNHGRIKIDPHRLAEDLSDFISQELNVSISRLFQGAASDIQIKAYTEIISEEIALFICFNSKYAFNEVLGNKLRHNFLSLKIEKAAKEFLENNSILEEEVTMIRALISTEVDAFCNSWITIYPNRSFFEELKNNIFDIVYDLFSRDEELVYINTMDVANEALSTFEKLLGDCRNKWLEHYKSTTISNVEQFATENQLNLSIAQYDELRNNLKNEFKESVLWISVNKRKQISNFQLKQHLLFEAKYFSSTKKVHEQISVEIYINNQKVQDDPFLDGMYMEPVSCFIENAIGNAIKHSDLKDKTSMEVKYFLTKDKLKIEFKNSHKEPNEVALKKYNAGLRCLQGTRQNESLKDKGGTGLRRVKKEFEFFFGNDFSLKLIGDRISSGYISLICEFPIKQFILK